MGCDHIRGKGPNGETFEMFICSRGSKAKPCAISGCRRRSTKLCDFPLGGAKKGKTCDRALCEDHAHKLSDISRIDAGLHQQDSVDYCPTHYELTRGSAPTSREGEERSNGT